MTYDDGYHQELQSCRLYSCDQLLDIADRVLLTWSEHQKERVHLRKIAHEHCLQKQPFESQRQLQEFEPIQMKPALHPQPKVQSLELVLLRLFALLEVLLHGVCLLYQIALHLSQMF